MHAEGQLSILRVTKDGAVESWPPPQDCWGAGWGTLHPLHSMGMIISN